MTKVPRACKKLPQLTKRCMSENGQSSKDCKKLPTITKKCQRLSESWQLLAESLKKVANKGGDTVAPKDDYEHYVEGSNDEDYESYGYSEDGEAASESTKNEIEMKGTVDTHTSHLSRHPHTHPSMGSPWT